MSRATTALPCGAVNLVSPVDAVIAAFYRAGAGDLPWSDALRRMGGLFDAWGVHLVGVRASDGAVVISHDVGPGMRPAGMLDYLLHWQRRDPRSSLVMGRPVNDWMSCHEHFDEAFVARSPFYRDFLIPQGGRYVCGSRVFQDDEFGVIVGIHRGLGSMPLSRDEVTLAQRLGCHLQTALGLWRRQHAMLTRAVLGQAVLDRLARPVLLVDKHLRVQACNRAADALLASDGRLWRRGDVLAACTASQQALASGVRSAVRDATAPGYGHDRTVVRVAGGTAADLLVELSAVNAAESLHAFGAHDLALVQVHDLAASGMPDRSLIAAAYGLTPAEAHVAARVAGGESVMSIARAHCVSPCTVRSQLYAVFGKVGVRRQAELVVALNRVRSGLD